MQQVSKLTGAFLSYWVARAEDYSAECLSIRTVPRSDRLICVHELPPHQAALVTVATYPVTFPYDDSWFWCGPLIAKWKLQISCISDIWLVCRGEDKWWIGEGDTPQEAICRAVVRAKFGNEVEDVEILE